VWDDWVRGLLARPDPAGKLPALPVLPHAYNFSQETVVWVRGPTGSAGGPPAWYSIHDDGGANPRGHDGSGRAARAPTGCPEIVRASLRLKSHGTPRRLKSCGWPRRRHFSVRRLPCDFSRRRAASDITISGRAPPRLPGGRRTIRRKSDTVQATHRRREYPRAHRTGTRGHRLQAPGGGRTAKFTPEPAAERTQQHITTRLPRSPAVIGSRESHT